MPIPIIIGLTVSTIAYLDKKTKKQRRKEEYYAAKTEKEKEKYYKEISRLKKQYS